MIKILNEVQVNINHIEKNNYIDYICVNYFHPMLMINSSNMYMIEKYLIFEQYGYL